MFKAVDHAGELIGEKMKHSSKKLLWSACAAALLSCSFAQAQDVPRWKESYAAETAGKYSAAQADMDSIIAQTPGHEFALMRKGWLEYLQGKHAESAKSYAMAVAVNPYNIEARLGLTLPLMAMKRWQEASEEARKIIAVSPYEYTANTRMIVCSEAMSQWDEMAKRSSEMSKRFPSDTGFLVYLARAESWRGNEAAARAAYLKAIERMPSHVEALAYLKKTAK